MVSDRGCAIEGICDESEGVVLVDVYDVVE